MNTSLPPRRTLTLALLSLLQFLIAIDVTVVNVALPAIGERFNARPAALSWVVTGYTLIGGGLLLLGGRLTDLLGRRRMFLLGAALFATASLAAGLAPNLETLIAARFAQGAGEALASPAAMSLIALLFPGPEERAKALGIWGAISAGGLVVGVLLSGAIVQLLDWRWIFGINVPLTAAVIALTPRLVHPDGRRGPNHHLDLPGAALLTGGPLAFVYGVLSGSATAVLAGAALIGAFVLVEARTKNPLVPLSFFAHRTRAGYVAVQPSAAHRRRPLARPLMHSHPAPTAADPASPLPPRRPPRRPARRGCGVPGARSRHGPRGAAVGP
ncbi:MFS transporter [Streptomyces sp. NPDC086554]|uniref:MFS transporter n=1 Tax=Streptomyces sp. NPDC086554 TaxID=3154864 RepID=UPI00343B139B